MIFLKKKWFDCIRNESDLRLIAFFDRIQPAIESGERINPDLILINLSLPFLLGINPEQIIAQFSIDLPIICLTYKDNIQEFKQICQGGGRAYLLKNTQFSEIINAIRLVNLGYFYLDPQLAQRYIFETSKPQEKEVSQKIPKSTNLDNSDRFLGELQALNHESKSIRSILKKLENRLSYLPSILEVFILAFLLLILIIIIEG